MFSLVGLLIDGLHDIWDDIHAALGGILYAGKNSLNYCWKEGNKDFLGSGL
jgi:hypothetical protein